MGNTLPTLGIEGGQEADPIALQPSHPTSGRIHMSVADKVIQEFPPIVPTAQ